MESIWTPEIPGKAFEEFLAQNLGAAQSQKNWEPGDGPLPSLYLSHGAPPVFDDREWMDDFFRWAQSFPKPRAILIVSAHWESAPLALSTPHGRAGLVYDFGGFADVYYTMRYDTPDAFDLAAKIAALMPESEPVHQSNSRGLDQEFDAWADEALKRGDIDTLANYKTTAPGMPYAHPTVEHFTPLFVALGAASSPDAKITTAIDGYRFGFSRRSIEVA